MQDWLTIRHIVYQGLVIEDSVAELLGRLQEEVQVAAIKKITPSFCHGSENCYNKITVGFNIRTCLGIIDLLFFHLWNPPPPPFGN